MVEVASTFSEVFEEVSGILARLDVLAGFADIAACAPIEYTRPQIRPMEDGNIEIFNGRHPCVEVQDNVSFIPNDTQLLKGTSYFHIITGPNMGGWEKKMTVFPPLMFSIELMLASLVPSSGKSTYIRQLGVIVFMAQVGSYVPADSATISIRDCIFARVGASGDIHRYTLESAAWELESVTLSRSVALQRCVHRLPTERSFDFYG